MSKKSKNKFFVVWVGHKPGIYESWPDCQAATSGYPDARFKGFPTRAAAEAAFKAGSAEYWGTGKHVSALSDDQLKQIGQPISPSLCVDAAWHVETKVMEYQGVWLPDGTPAFARGPFEQGTNNVGEFLAIVHGLALLQQRGSTCPIYSDSLTARSWVQGKTVNSKSMQKGDTSAQINQLVERAVRWLGANEYDNRVLKWETEAWGENPADYGRK